MLDGEASRGGTRGDAELVVDAAQVLTDGPEGEEQALRRFGVSHPLRDEAQDFDLTCGEPGRVQGGDGSRSELSVHRGDAGEGGLCAKWLTDSPRLVEQYPCVIGQI